MAYMFLTILPIYLILFIDWILWWMFAVIFSNLTGPLEYIKLALIILFYWYNYRQLVKEVEHISYIVGVNEIG